MSVGSIRRVMGAAGMAGGLGLGMASVASAHVGVGTGNGLAAGLAHPLAGLDHVLAVVAVALWAAQQAGRARWAIPTAFVTVMMVGGVLGSATLGWSPGEQGLALSIVLAGTLVAAAVRPSLALGIALTSAVAFAQGHVHGSEMPAVSSALAFVAGVALATAALLAGVVGAAIMLRQRPPLAWSTALRSLGALIALVGACMLVQRGFFA